MHHENTVCTRKQGHIQHKAGKQYCLRGLDQFCVKPGLKTEGISILFWIFLPCFVQLSDFSVTSHLLPKVGRKLTQIVTFEQNSIIDLQSDGLLNKFLISWVGCINNVQDFSLSCFNTWLIPPPVSRPTIQLSKLSWKCYEECFIIQIQYQPLHQT